ncbi:hypothetical protein [Pimelobacter simplex]|uniref:hypothetical protein n=1 Tax=Nocardioides simplex TaxID=2045 RepID=UPI003AAC7815
MTPSLSRRRVLGAAVGGPVAALGATLPEPADAVPLVPPARTRIDVHCHHIPDFYRASLAEHGITEAGGKKLPAWSPQRAVTFMNSFGIAAQVVSISEPGVGYLPTAAERNAMARQINDYTYETLIKGSGTLAKRSARSRCSRSATSTTPTTSPTPAPRPPARSRCSASTASACSASTTVSTSATPGSSR